MLGSIRLYRTIPGLDLKGVRCIICNKSVEKLLDMSDFFPGICQCYVYARFAIKEGKWMPQVVHDKISTKEAIFTKVVLKKTKSNLRQVKKGWVLLLHSNNQSIPKDVKRKIIMIIRDYFIERVCEHHWNAAEMLIYPSLKFLE